MSVENCKLSTIIYFSQTKSLIGLGYFCLHGATIYGIRIGMSFLKNFKFCNLVIELLSPICFGMLLLIQEFTSGGRCELLQTNAKSSDNKMHTKY